MRFSRKALAATLATAMISTSVTPVMARGFGSFGIGTGFGSNSWGSVGVSSGWGGGHGWRGGRRHRGGDDDTGEVLGGILIGAILTGAILSSAKKKKERAAGVPPRDQRWEGRDETASAEDTRDRGDIRNEDQAVDACAMAAEAKAGRTSSVRTINKVTSNSDGWDVEGIVENRTSWRDRASSRQNFTCSVDNGQVANIYLDNDQVAAR